MNPFLSLIMGQQVAPAAVDEGPTGNILVTGPYNASEEMPRQARPPEGYTLDNTNDIKMRDEALRRGEEASDRRGMFGMRGTLRDVVGLLGDAFLVQSGNNPMYMPTRQKERFSDAMAGASNNPMAAYERAMGVDPGSAEEFYQNYAKNNLTSQRIDLDRSDLARRLEDDAMTRAGQIMAAAVASGDPALTAKAELAIQELAKSTGIPVERLMAGGDPRLVAGREATANQSLRLPQQERMVDVAEGNLAARKEQVAIAARNARNAETRTAIYRQAIEDRIRAGAVDEAMDFYKMMEDDGKGGKGKRDNETKAEPKGTLKVRSNW
jgi:hypothetical protein